jgi:hypothetical protein
MADRPAITNAFAQRATDRLVELAPSTDRHRCAPANSADDLPEHFADAARARTDLCAMPSQSYPKMERWSGCLFRKTTAAYENIAEELGMATGLIELTGPPPGLP